jgi:hypothetical protein
MMISILLLALAPYPLPLPSVVPPSMFQEPEVVRFAAAKKAATATLVAELEEYVAWCQKSKAYLQRDLANQIILDWDSDHKEARKALGFKWSKKEAKWIAPKSTRKAKDLDAKSAVIAKAMRDEILGDFSTRILTAMDHDTALKTAERQTVIDSLLDARPNNAELRTRNGQVIKTGTELEPIWILKESQRALVWRKLLDERKRDLFANVPAATPVPANATERDLGVPWSVLQGNKRVRVLSTGGQEEADKVSATCHVVWDYVRDLFGHRFEPSYAVYLLDNQVDQATFIKGWPDIEPDTRKVLLQTAGYGFSTQAIAQWGDLPEKRIDGSCRLSLAIIMGLRFGVTSNQGWVQEGFGMYVTDQLLGTRLTFFVQKSDYEDKGKIKLDRAMYDSSSDWLTLAKEELSSEPPPNLSFLVGRNVNTLTPPDLLVSYALASYFLEGCEPAVTQKVLTGLGAGKNPVEVLEAELGFDMGTLAKRLRQYLEEIGK